ncbi:MAG: hypothetical protein P4L49_15060 [Desulfosporosinus sp.]|nr:hypothetical protein [Desulfosporosinus sp.]
MNKNQRLDIIIRTLALPFIDFNYFCSDPLCLKVACYEKLLNNRGIRVDLKREYEEHQEKIIGYMASITQVERLDDILQLLNIFYSDIDMIHYLREQSRATSVDTYYIKRIFDISSSLVILRDGKISIRMWSDEADNELFKAYSGLHKVEIWSALARIMTPDVFIAAYYVNAQLDNIDYLSNVTSNLSVCDTPLAKILNRGIAETHLHLNAGMSYLSLWEMVTDFTQLDVPQFSSKKGEEHFLKKEYQDFPHLFLAGLLRLLMATYLQEQENDGEFCDMLDFFRDNLKNGQESVQQLELDILLTVMPDREPVERKQAIWQLYYNFYQKRFESIPELKRTHGIEDDDSVFDVLGRSTYRRYGYLNTSYEILFLYKALSFIHRHSDCPQFTHIFLQYLRVKNDYFGNKLQSAKIKGLRFFQDFFNRASKAPYANSYGGSSKKEAKYLSIFKDQGKCSNLKKLELKISPEYPIQIVSPNRPDGFKLREIKMSIAKQVLEIFCSYLRYFKEMGNKHSLDLDEIEERGLVSFPTIGLVYHFIKTDDMDRYLGDICWVSAQTIDVLSSNSMQTMRKRHMEFWDALNEMIRDIPHLGEYIVGIDAASNELSAEPWVFAPVYKHLRRKENTYPIQLASSRHIQNVGLTYHVGEDYRHILSGLRYIDEVITHFGYKAGDRIGHALALQVDIHNWIKNNEIVAIPVMEYLENLLWLWYLSNQYSEIKCNVVPDLETKIMDTAGKMYENIAGLSPYVLWKGYSLKFQSLERDKIEDMKAYYLPIRNERCFFPSQGRSLKRCFCKLYSDREADSYPNDPIWDEDKLLLTHFCPVYVQSYCKPMFVRTSQEEIILLIKVQECLKKKIEQAGIYVETNPTSNATIGDVNCLFEHPITNLNSNGLKNDKDSNVLVTINSDDPLVFNTNVENEIANVYHMLTNHAYSREDVLGWIDKVRQHGLDSSFIKQVKKPSVQKRELEEIIEDLKRVK